MAKDLSLIFERKPEQLGLRGDPYLWDEMRDLFGGASLDISNGHIVIDFEDAGEKILGLDIL